MTNGYRPWSKFNAHSWSVLNARRHVCILRLVITVFLQAIGQTGGIEKEGDLSGRSFWFQSERTQTMQ